MRLIEISLRDLIIKSSRDTHHHSASHILLCVSETSRDCLKRSSRDLSSYAHMLDISSRHAIICTYTSRLLHRHYAQEMLHGHARHRVLGRLAHTQSGLGEGDLPLPRRIYPF